VWRHLSSWPAGCEAGCITKPTRIYLTVDSRLDFQPPKTSAPQYTEYISDPAKPVPFQSRPIPTSDFGDSGWEHWLVNDQRNVATRPDVISFVSDQLTAALKISGQPLAHLIASTSGTDSDWIVKLIDVYPGNVPEQPEMGGYQMMVASDIFRGRYRDSFAQPRAISANTPLPYDFALPTANHVFLPGHRILVQIQSSWFPLYDRNPQTFVPNIFLAKPGDYRVSTQRVYHSLAFPSSIILPIVEFKQ